MDTIKQLCDKLNEENLDGVKNLLTKESLSVRNTFALGAKYSPPSHQELATKIIQATQLKNLSGKRIVSWNINSLRAGIVDQETAKCKTKRVIQNSSPMGELVRDVNPDIICLQETKLQQEHEKCFDISGYYTYWNSSTDQKGYSGVAIWSKEKPLSVDTTLEKIPEVLQREGRILTAYYQNFVVVNIYTPNTLRAGEKPLSGWDAVKDPEKRKLRKMNYELYMFNRKVWDNAILEHLEKLKEKYTNVILCGDLNVARNFQDIHTGLMTEHKLEVAQEQKEGPLRIAELQKRIKAARQATKLGGGAGYRLEERENLELLLSRDFADVFRDLYPNDYGFTYWDMTKFGYRQANNGWRIDYFIVSGNIISYIRDIKILKDLGVQGKKVPSDHAPVILYF
jgi:exodeoxyribonuclease-3